MKFQANRLELKKLLNGNTELVLEIEDKQSKIATQINNQESFQQSKLEVSIDRLKHKRSLGHNALFWDMCNYLSEHINDPLITANTIYRQLIREYGVSTIYPVDDNILEMIISDWDSRGDGWLTQKLRKSKLDGNFTNVKFWFGSSIYDSKQFWKLVEGLKKLCRKNGLDISHYDSQLQASMKAFEEKETSAMQNKENSQK